MAMWIMTAISLAMEMDDSNNRIFVHTTWWHFKYYVINTETWKAKYGRIGASPQEHTYSKYDVSRKISEKIWKGYQEITGNKLALSTYKLDKYE